MALKQVMIHSIRYAEANGKWVTILKGKDREEYFPIYMNASQANIIKRELIPGRLADPDNFERFLIGKDITGYDLESVLIDEQDGYIRAKLVFRADGSTVNLECPVAGAIALAYRKNAEIFAEESSFFKTEITE